MTAAGMTGKRAMECALVMQLDIQRKEGRDEHVRLGEGIRTIGVRRACASRLLRRSTSTCRRQLDSSVAFG